MTIRHPPFPRLWLMTDERMGNQLLSAIAALPMGSGIVFRHYSLDVKNRRRLFYQVQVTARRNRHMLLYAGTPSEARRLGAYGAHGRQRGCLSAPVHNAIELNAAERKGAALLFVSPVFQTRSHPGTKTLGRVRFGRLVRNTPLPVIALGGMNERKARSLSPFGIYGWAGIDALIPDV